MSCGQGFSLALGVAAWTVVGAQPSAAQGEPLHALVTPGNPWNVTDDDMARLRSFYTGVGFEFEPTEAVARGLQGIGVRRLRLINIDGRLTGMKEDGSPEIEWSPHLKRQLLYCRQYGFTPHLIIGHVLQAPLAQGSPSDQRLDGHWAVYEKYVYAFLDHVLREEGFADAYWEVGNEPDINGAAWLRKAKYPNGARPMYEAYFELYRHIAAAAGTFEQDHPDLPRVRLGGPASAGPFSYRFGPFNWHERFLKDVAREKVKIDFFSYHFYGNCAPLGRRPGFTVYPPFRDIARQIRGWVAQHKPGLPIFMTEWGPSYHTNMSPPGITNGNHVGAAWCAAFLNELLETGHEAGIYLVSTDIRFQEGERWLNNWGWPALFTNPNVHGPTPKATYNVFRLFSMMAPQRVEATNPSETVGCLASRDEKRLTLLVWSFGWSYRGEGAEGAEGEVEHPVTITIRQPGFLGPRATMVRYLVSEGVSDAYGLFAKGQPFDGRETLQQVSSASFVVTGDTLTFGFGLPPCSVTLVVLTPEASAEE